jgi:asparagine synthase (glutamine-hydrolysing)
MRAGAVHVPSSGAGASCGNDAAVGAAGVQGPTPYFSIAEEFRKAEAAPSALSDAALDEQLRAICSDSMRHHMVSDVPVGIFLSAGVDSSVLAALGAQQNPDKLHAITLGFREYRGTPDDETGARRAACRRARHSPDDPLDRAQRFSRSVAKLLRRHGPGFDRRRQQLPRLECAGASGLKGSDLGLGGDELFGGYPSFRDIPRMRRLVPRAPRAGKAAAPVCRRRSSGA